MNDANKIISNFKKGVADALLRGKENNPNNLDYYRQGYDYGIFLYSEINEEENIDQLPEPYDVEESKWPIELNKMTYRAK